MNLDELKVKYSGKRVLLTGHTGFKGSWMTLLLNILGAKVIGFSLQPNTTPALYNMLGFTNNEVISYIGDIREYEKINNIIQKEKPDFIIHMAAQPIVRESYVNPHYTFETNVMGTVNLLEAIRQSNSVKSVLNVTTDKVYKNFEKNEGYREDDMLDGFDPYSNSKSCSELVTHSYVNSFLKDNGIPVSTARAGNVIGGGDFEKDRIIPDCVRAVLSNNEIFVRNPNSVRPYQHVLEPLYAYLLILSEQSERLDLQGAYNIGPDDDNIITTRALVTSFCNYWGYDNVIWNNTEKSGPHEAKILRLNNEKVKKTFGWFQHWNIDQSIEKIVEWTKVYKEGDSVRKCMEKQINDYFIL